MVRELEVTISNRDAESGGGRHVRNGEGGAPGPPRGDPDPKPDVSDEQMRTLWVGGVSDKAEDEVLYELFQNAGPLQKVHHPADKETKKKKAFCFVVFEHGESIKYAYDLLNGVELYGQRLRLQHKETGLGINIGRPNIAGLYTRGGDAGGRNHNRSYSTSSLPQSNHFQGNQQQFMNNMNNFGGNNMMGGGQMYMNNGQGVDSSWGGGFHHQQQQQQSPHQPPLPRSDSRPPPPPPPDFDRRGGGGGRRFDDFRGGSGGHDDRTDDRRGGGGRYQDRGGRDHQQQDRYRDRSSHRDSGRDNNRSYRR